MKQYDYVNNAHECKTAPDILSGGCNGSFDHVVQIKVIRQFPQIIFHFFRNIVTQEQVHSVLLFSI